MPADFPQLRSACNPGPAHSFPLALCRDGWQDEGMATYRVHFNTTISLAVTVEADDPDAAADAAWQPAEDYLQTVYGHHGMRIVAEATLDGVGADEVNEVDEPSSTEARPWVRS